MALKMIESLGSILCEAIDLIKEAGVHNSFLDKADMVCKTVLPELDALEKSDAGRLAEAAYDMAKQVKKAISS